MPMYEYVCMKCEEHFEELVRNDEEVACPNCAATNVARQLSTFAMIGTAGQTGAFGGGGGCCGGGGGRGVGRGGGGGGGGAGVAGCGVFFCLFVGGGAPPPPPPWRACRRAD